MSRDYEPISADGKTGPGWRMLLGIMIVAFVGGIILTGWLATRWDLFGTDEKARSAETAELAGQPRTDGDGTISQPRTAQDEAEARAAADGLASRMADLENRMSRINVQAELASGNAARAEGLLIAFATRRAIEQGRPLGYLEQQLQLRFGRAQPEAVRTLRRFSADPVLLDDLQARLDRLNDELSGPAEGNFVQEISRELSELFLVRPQGAPVPTDSARLTRAHRFAEKGNITAAIAEVEKLPRADAAKQWLRDARRYQQAVMALEAIEMAAIFEPHDLRDAYGQTVEQPSPLPTGPAGPLDPTGQSESNGEPAASGAPSKPVAAPAAANASEDDQFFGF